MINYDIQKADNNDDTCIYMYIDIYEILIYIRHTYIRTY